MLLLHETLLSRTGMRSTLMLAKLQMVNFSKRFTQLWGGGDSRFPGVYMDLLGGSAAAENYYSNWLVWGCFEWASDEWIW